MRMVPPPVYTNHIHDKKPFLRKSHYPTEWVKLGWGPKSLDQVKPSVYHLFVDRCVVRLFSHLLQNKPESYANYYKTIIKCSSASSTVLVTSLIYLTRLGAKSSHLLFKYPAHLLYTALLMLAFVHVEDSPYHTKSWAEVSAFSVPVLNMVVRDVLAAFDYRLVVDKMCFAKWEMSALKFFQGIPSSAKPSSLSLSASQIIPDPFLFPIGPVFYDFFSL